jgi:hypothetical protein
MFSLKFCFIHGRLLHRPQNQFNYWFACEEVGPERGLPLTPTIPNIVPVP